MTSKQSQYIITYDDFNDSFLCVIDGETISANFVGEILSYIAKLYDHTPKFSVFWYGIYGCFRAWSWDYIPIWEVIPW